KPECFHADSILTISSVILYLCNGVFKAVFISVPKGEALKFRLLRFFNIVTAVTFSGYFFVTDAVTF
ncbi:MAG TPA: hypothetical protein P5188_12395, partial [Flavobacterium sp.]|nr:hypothetical protein [Flavobacterium sp.]